MRSIIGGSLLSVLLTTTVIADTSSMNAGAPSMGILENDYVRAGVNGTSGTFGSGGSTRPGLQYDSAGTGTFPADSAQGDYLTPGSPFDGFSLKIDGTNSSNNNGRSNSWADADGLTDGAGTFTWTGTNADHSGWTIENTYSLGTTSEYIDITTDITAGSAADDVYFSRHIDPDAMPETGDTSATDNVLGYGTIPDSNVAFSEATVSRYALGLYSTDSNVDAGISTWSQEADAYTENTVDGDGSNTNRGDNTIGLTWHWTSVGAGDILTANYAYIFGPSAFGAASTAIAGGAGGGADITTGTLEDVGSATDAAAGSGSAPVITTETIIDTSRPVLTAGITTHNSSVAAGVQTIARETTTTTTTPMTTVTYADGVETGRADATNVVTTAITDPGSFVARMDQGNVLESSVDVHNLGFADGISTGRLSSSAANSSIYSLGTSVAADNGLLITGGLNRISSDNDSGNMSTTHFGIGLGQSLDTFTIRGSANSASSDVSYSRTIGTFSNQGSYSTADRWLELEVEPNTGAIRPVIGATIGNKTTDAYTETGSIQSKIVNPEYSETYKYATLGVNFDLPVGEASISRTTEGTTRLGVGIDYNVRENINIVADLNRTMNDATAITGISAGIRINF